MNSEYNNPEPEETDDELYEHHKFVADKGQQPLRVDKYLMNYIEGATRNKIQTAAKDGNIYVNEVAVKSNYKVMYPNMKAVFRTIHQNRRFQYAQNLIHQDEMDKLRLMKEFEYKETIRKA